MQLTRLSKNSLYLRIPFTVRKSHMAADPLYWFFLAYLSPEIMGLADPAFLVPWDVLRKIADPEEKGDFWQFNFEASMEPGSQDKYAPYRVNTLDLGKKLLSILNDIRNSKISLPLVGQASTSLPLVGRVGEAVINIPDLVFTRRI